MLAGNDVSSLEVHAANSLCVWNRIVGDTFGYTNVESRAANFAGALAHGMVDDVQIIHIMAQQSVVQKHPHRQRAAGNGSMLLHLQVRGTSINTQDARCARLTPGEAVLCDPGRDYSVEFVSTYEMFVIRFPVLRLAMKCPDIDPGSDTAIRLDPGCSALLLGFLAAAWTQWSCLCRDADWRECVTQTVLDLSVRAIRGCDERHSGNPSKLLQSEILGYIRRNLKDPQLRTSAIARSVGVSGRTVQTVFEKMATTASEHILSERLRLAAALLRGRRNSVTKIAMELGFNDASYFSKCFHKYYGRSPRTFAREHQTRIVTSEFS